jgi:hypothetical protein
MKDKNKCEMYKGVTILQWRSNYVRNILNNLNKYTEHCLEDEHVSSEKGEGAQKQYLHSNK